MKVEIDHILDANPRNIIGLMSGTSADGIDAALVAVSGCGAETRWELKGFVTVPFDEALRTEIIGIQDPKADRVLPRLSALNYRLGDVYAEACRKLVDRVGARMDDIHLIGCHGQTVFHDTGQSDRPDFVRSTFQCGEPGALAERT
ncbi:MAG TPA: anhydro-N-acetylmuramic acid kinase, partial [Candidatus Eisenbacteria bacterium]